MTEVKKQFRELLSPREISKMRRAGLVVWQAHQYAARMLQPDVTTQQVNEVYRQTFLQNEAEPLFLNYGAQAGKRPPFPAELCISIDEELVHGIPKQRKLKTGQIVSLDTGCRVQGWCGDAAVTLPIGPIDPTVEKLLQVTNETLNLAIQLLDEKKWWSEIAREMEEMVVGAGFSVVKKMVGHGIGRNLHESPSVPNFYSSTWAKEEDFDIRPGVVLAIEPMVGMGKDQISEANDQWTIYMSDRQPSAHFEHTVAITKEGAVRLTGPPTDNELELVPADLRDSSNWIAW